MSDEEVSSEAYLSFYELDFGIFIVSRFSYNLSATCIHDISQTTKHPSLAVNWISHTLKLAIQYLYSSVFHLLFHDDKRSAQR